MKENSKNVSGVPGNDEDYIKKAVQFDPPDRPSGLVLGYNRVLDKVIVDHANNMNVAVYGASGSGKSFTFVKPNILMCIDNGFSFVASDPSGELFRDTSMLAEKQGFEVRVLNTKHIFESNGWDFLMPIKLAAKSDDPSKSGTAETLADQLVTVVMENATGGQKSGENYFQQIAGNLFLFLIRYVAMSPNFAGREEERTIGTCYDILVQLQRSGGDYPMFDELPPTDPAYAAWKTFKGLSDNQKSSAMSDLEGVLHVFGNDTIKEAFAHNEIDLSLPGKKPCAYYLVTSVSDSTFRFIQSLFFSMIFQSLFEEGEQRPDNKLQVPVYFLLDEFKAIGRIKDFEAKIATARKYGISISIIFQDPSQMDSSYGDDAASILANCAVHVVLGVNDIESAKTISDVTGVTTDGKQNLLSPDEIVELSNEGRTLIIVQGMKPYLATPYPFLKHCLAKDLKRVESEFVPPWQMGEKLMSKERTFNGEIQDTQKERDTKTNKNHA
jgi:type IV secretion system protein VirD4